MVLRGRREKICYYYLEVIGLSVNRYFDVVWSLVGVKSGGMWSWEWVFGSW